MPTTVQRFFNYAHLPAGGMRMVSKLCAILAHKLEYGLLDGPEKSAGMRKLLEAKDCFVRAALDNPSSVATLLGRERQECIARVCHEVNRAYCEALGDMSQPTWEDAPDWQRSSARMGVDLHLSGDFGPEAGHISWSRQKVEDGWRYGPVKDPAARTHPCLVPFNELPREQQAKDFIFRAVVHALRDLT